MLKGVNHITLVVTDIYRAFDFYRDILGFNPLCRWHEGAYFTVGDTWFCLNLDKSHQPTVGYTHIAFSVDACDFLSIKEKIISSGVKIFKENKSEGDSLYFLDPDGHQLEIHVGDYETRINSKKANPGSWQDVEFFM